MANAIAMKKDDSLSSTVELINKFDRAFDILNIRYKAEGVENRNKYKMLLTSPEDWRFEVGVEYNI